MVILQMMTPKKEKSNTTDRNNPGKEIRHLLDKSGLFIGRIPQKKKEQFKQLAKEEFCDDYGWCLSQLMKDSDDYTMFKKILTNDKFKIIPNED